QVLVALQVASQQGTLALSVRHVCKAKPHGWTRGALLQDHLERASRSAIRAAIQASISCSSQTLRELRKVPRRSLRGNLPTCSKRAIWANDSEINSRTCFLLRKRRLLDICT